MSRIAPNDTRTLYQVAVASALDEMKFALESGTQTRIIFISDHVPYPLDLIDSKPGDAASIQEHLATAKSYFDTQVPRPGVGSKIWDTFLAVKPKLLASGGRTTFSIYTADQDTKSAKTRAQVEAELQAEFKGNTLPMRVLNPADGPLPPRAAVKVAGQLPILDAAAFAAGGNGAAGQSVAAEAKFSSIAGEANTLSVLPAVSVVPIQGAPMIQVTAGLAKPLTKGNPAGNVTLSAAGEFPAGANRYEYDLRFFFAFRSRPMDKASPDEVIVAGQPVRLVVASTIKPEAQLAVSDANVRMKMGEYKDLTVTINYNAAAGDKVCQFRALTATGVSAEIFDPGRPAPGPADKGESNLSVTLPGVAAGDTGGSAKVVLRLRGVKPAKGQVQVSGRLGDGSPAAPAINVEVQASVVQVELSDKDNHTQLVEEGKGRDTWQDLGHPLALRPGFPVKGATAALTLNGEGKDVEVAFDRNGAQSTTVPLNGPAIVPLFARLHSAVPASPPSMPSIQIELSDKTVVLSPPATTLELEGVVVLSAPDFWMSNAEGGDAAPAGSQAPAVPGSARMLILNGPPKVRLSQEDTREVLIKWNGAASGTVVDVSSDTPDGGSVEAIEPVTPSNKPADEFAGLTALSPWRLQLGHRGPGGPQPASGATAATSGTLRIRFKLPAIKPASRTAHYGLKFTAMPAGSSPAGSTPSISSPASSTPAGSGAAGLYAPWLVQSAYNVAPTVFNVVVDKGGAAAGAIPLFVGASQPVANLRAWSDGLPGKLAVKFQPSAPGQSVGFNLGEQGPEVDVGQQPRQMSLNAKVKDFAMAGKQIPGSLAFSAQTDDPDAVIEAREADRPGAPASDQVAFLFEVKACSLHAMADGKDCKVLPGDRIMVSAPNTVTKTSAARRPVLFKLLGAEALPEGIASEKVTAAPRESSGLIRSVKFEVDGKVPQEQVTLADLMGDQVRGLVITSSPDKGENLLRTEEVDLKVPDLAIVVPLAVNLRLPDQTNYLLWVGGTGVAVLALFIVLFLVKRLVKREPETKPPLVDSGTLWGDSVSPARAAVRSSSKAASPARSPQADERASAPPIEPEEEQGESLW